MAYWGGRERDEEALGFPAVLVLGMLIGEEGYRELARENEIESKVYHSGRPGQSAQHMLVRRRADRPRDVRRSDRT